MVALGALPALCLLQSPAAPALCCCPCAAAPVCASSTVPSLLPHRVPGVPSSVLSCTASHRAVPESGIPHPPTHLPGPSPALAGLVSAAQGGGLVPGQHRATACAPGTVSLLSDGSTQGQLRAQPWFCRVLAVFCGAVGSAHVALWCPVTCPVLNLIVPLCGWHWVMCVCVAVVSPGCARVWPQMQVQLPGSSGDSSVCRGGWSQVRDLGVMLRDVGDEMWLSPAAKSRPPLVCKRPPGRAQRWEWDLEQPLLWGALGQRSRGCVGTVLLPGGRRGAGLPRCCCIAAPSRERSWEGRGCCIAGLRLELCKWRCVGAAAMLWSGARRALRSTRPSSHLFLPRFVLLECFFHSSRCCLPGPIEAATSFFFLQEKG